MPTVVRDLRDVSKRLAQNGLGKAASAGSLTIEAVLSHTFGDASGSVKSRALCGVMI
jgi:hypothetical protein